MTNTTNLLQAAKDAVTAIDEKFGKDILLLEIGPISSIADYFIIAEARNPNQVNAMVDGVEKALAKYELNVRHIEGMQKADWVLMDFGDIIVHIFNEESRKFYDLERTWRDAQVIQND